MTALAHPSPQTAGGTVEAVKANAAARASALLEAKVVKLLELLKGVVRDTVDRTEKKLVQTWEELQADKEEVRCWGRIGARDVCAWGVLWGLGVAV